MMPLTKLSEQDYRDWKAIVDHIVGSYYWNYLSDDDINLTRFELNLVMWLGEEFFPSLELFIQYTEGTKFNNGVGKGTWKGPYIPVQQDTFTEDEQRRIDDTTRAFLNKYPDLNRVTPKAPFDKVAVISHMPDTKITETLDEKVLDINKFRLEFDLWERRINDGASALSEKENQAVDKAGEELYGSLDLFHQWQKATIAFTEKE